ncbi:hypothetical protein Nepgr_033300 [Nepenthes gracilis]|uniref:Serine/threonine-protein kinase ATM n=1 Tax=Nepenthes gracilis TaxID=150966 RepID=A0AAD3TME4_NEPGR|nr:hypothetical protein Nepgr_033300 [Nepenthes gracilis]
MATVTSRDVEDIVAKLSSDKARTREEGIKLLNTWLEGERSISFCKYIGSNTAMLKPNQIPYSETWPFLVTLLVNCVLSEISAGKRRVPKLMYAKTIRILVQRAEGTKGVGTNLPLVSMVKTLFGHILDVLRKIPSFQSDYGIILRHLLAVRDYRFHMRKRVYSGLVLFYLEKVEASLCEKNYSQACLKEEVFRSILSLHSLLENPPGDFPHTLREDVVRGFIEIFASVRDEGKISRKLMECLNTYLLEDGPNLGYMSLEVHSSVRHFLFRSWLTTHDRSLKDAFILYARLQLNLTRGIEDGGPLVEQLLEVVGRELDQTNTSSIGTVRTDAAKDEKLGILTNSQQGLAELAALVFYRACVHMNGAPLAGKRARREHAVVCLNEGLMTGKWLWHAAFCYLSRYYHMRISKDLFAYWFDGICSSFERILNYANIEHSYDGLLWTLRSLEELSSVLMLPVSIGKILPISSSTSNKIYCGWQTVWSCLVHGLPLFSNITPIADAAFRLLGNVVSYDILNSTIVSQDVWDHQCFEHVTSMSVLYFLSCYFSRKGSQGNVRDNLHLRQRILRGVLSLLSVKESLMLDEHIVTLLPAAVYALCAGFPVIPSVYRGNSLPLSAVDASGAADYWVKGDEQESEQLDGPFEYFVEVLMEINDNSGNQVILSENCQAPRLPRQVRDPLLCEMENCILRVVVDDKAEKNFLSDIFLECALLSNFLYGSFSSRPREEISTFCDKICQHLLELVDSAVSVIQNFHIDVKSHGCLSSNSTFDGTCSIITSFKCFVCCPFFNRVKDKNIVDPIVYNSIIHSLERLLKAVCDLYVESLTCGKNFQSETVSLEFSSYSPSTGNSFPLDSTQSKSGIIDMELDVNGSDDVPASGPSSSGIYFSSSRWKMDMISLISSCVSILPLVTWDILFNILHKESHPKVCGSILHKLCQNPHWSSSVKLMGLVTLINEMIDLRMSLRLDCSVGLSPIWCLLRTIFSVHNMHKDKNGCLYSMEGDTGQCLMSLGELVNKVSDSNLLDRHGRIKMVDCFCYFVRLTPLISQTMVEKLIMLLRDADYRVRFFLARQIGILFQTWDGHDELFQDICSNFGNKLVLCSKNKLVTAEEVLADGSQPRPTTETIVITLMHLAFYSEKVELEAVFMMCAISAIDPSQRELVKAALDKLSRQLHYANRSKYLDELMGCILFCWVACGVSLAALVEVRDLFVLDVEPNHFMKYCCQWLLPALILQGDISNLEWVASITGQSIAVLVESHFVPIFSVCMALHCSRKPGWEKGTLVLQSSILRIAEISEDERDRLIKKHMVSIVSYILGLASCASDPAAPLFSREIVQHAVQAVVDGFLEMEDSTTVGVVDKINIFRPDRVFMLIVEMHYKVAAAVNQRHRCRHLSGVEVLVNILGHRAAVSSTSCYLFNLIGQFISCYALQDQCCCMISILLKTFNSNPSSETTHVLGEQLQFLVSKLVACCIPSESSGENSCTPSSQVLSLLHLLTVDSDPSLHDYIREFEPFPEIDIFDRIRTFHLELCRTYSLRDHFLKFVKRSSYLPPRLLLWSLQALHRKLLEGGAFHTVDTTENEGGNHWLCDIEIVKAVWSLVRMCGLEDADNVRALVADFVSRVGIGDPCSVIFHIPGNSSPMHVCRSADLNGAVEINFNSDTCISEEFLIVLMGILKKYLMDDSVKIVDLTSQTLRGILSTERGQRALLSFDCYERSLIEVHSKGINLQLVEKCLLDLERKFTAEAKSLEEPSLWSTNDKTFETWICPLVYSLIGYCSDIILRLCQHIVLVKAEVAELLLSNVMVNLAGRTDLAVDLRQIISVQVLQHIFIESNELTQSVQVMLDALNELRICYVMERNASATMPSKRDSEKFLRTSSGYSSRSRSSAKVRDSAATMGAVVLSTSKWDKVYWVAIDYLVVARSAIISGSYFTAVMYVEHWCDDHFNNFTLGNPDFSHVEKLPHHIEILLSAVTRINESDSLYGIIQSYKLLSQITTFEHEGNWSKALEYYDLQVRSETPGYCLRRSSLEDSRPTPCLLYSKTEDEMKWRKPYKGLIRSLQQIGCSHILDLYCQGLVSRNNDFQHDLEFVELQYEAAWHASNWDFSVLCMGSNTSKSQRHTNRDHFNEDLHNCLRALQEGDSTEFHTQLNDSKQGLVLSIYHASEESTEHIYSTIVKLQILDHLGMAWDLRWKTPGKSNSFQENQNVFSEPVIPNVDQFSRLNAEWNCIVKQTKLHMNLLEPLIAFRRVLLQILGCKDLTVQHLLQASSILRKGSRISQAAAFLHEFKLICTESGDHDMLLYWLGRLEEAKLLRVQGQHQMAINLAKYIAEHNKLNGEGSDVYRLVGKWLAESRSSNSRTILDKYLKPAVSLAGDPKIVNWKSIARQCQNHFHLAHYADALFRSHEERLNSSEWQAAMRLRKHKTMELEALIKRLRSLAKAKKTDYSIKIQELQKQLAIDKEEAEKFQDDRDNFLNLALDGYKRCLVIGDKYDVRVVFRLISLWFSLSSRQNVINAMLSTIEEVQSYKFIPLVYQIASRLGSTKDVQGPHSFQFAVVSLVKKLAIDHPYHTIFQLLALANGDRIKDKQRSRNSFVVDPDKKLSAEKLLDELSLYHGAIIKQMKQMVEVYIKLAELETKREDTNRKMGLPREIRSLRQLELVPVVTATVPVDRSCQYQEGSFPHFKGLADSVVVMNGINAPKVVECYGSDGKTYRQLAKSGNDDLRQDAVMEQFFGLVNTFLQNHQDTWKRKLGVRTYKVVPFTPSAGVIEWVDGTLPLGEYLIGSTRNGGAHGQYGVGDWSFLKCREHMINAKDKRKAFQEVCENLRPVLHYFFLERFLQPADWFEKRLAYTRSVAASSMVGYIVGLGDRHSMNILIDQATAEVVHIDLGVAFEQGLMLKTPERVPFRLTRDIIDGMGVTGVEGVFRRCCEETLAVMRTNKEALLTIVEVFIHDPLYKWALSPLKALERQKETDDDVETNWEDSEDEYEGNKDAARALLRVKQKLDGYEEGEMRSVHGQVQQLIQDAIDPERLSQMFPGWASWL